jgi:predicted metalloprotease with PDZ domain
MCYERKQNAGRLLLTAFLVLTMGAITNAQEPPPRAVRKAAKAAARAAADAPPASASAVVSEPAPAAVITPAPRPGVVVRREFRPAAIRAPDVGIWFDPAATDSLLIADVAPNSTIARLGFIEGDRILAVNGAKVTREADFVKLLFAAERRDQPAEVLIIRKNKEQVILVDPAILMEEYVVVRQDPMERFGLVVDDRYDDRIVVWKVVPRSPAFYAGFRSGDVITTFRGRPVTGRQAFVDSVVALEPGVAEFEIRRGERVRPLRVEVPREWNVSAPNDVREERIDDRVERREAIRGERSQNAEVRDDNRDDRREVRREGEAQERREARQERVEDRRDDRRDNANKGR